MLRITDYYKFTNTIIRSVILSGAKNLVDIETGFFVATLLRMTYTFVNT